MASFTTYAEILTADHAQMKMYIAGIKKNPPGLVLQDVLAQTGGVYRMNTGLPEEFREEIRKVAELTDDERLLDVASLPEVSVSLEHLRHLDPQTRIVVGCRLKVTPEESTRLGLEYKGQIDPRTTIRS
jgi:hypothetical protein